LISSHFSSSDANRGKKGKTKLPTVISLGSRIKEYKQRCHKATGAIGKACDAKILEYDILKAKEKDGGTPPGNRSVTAIAEKATIVNNSYQLVPTNKNCRKQPTSRAANIDKTWLRQWRRI
jgi:hypothetical protein